MLYCFQVKETGVVQFSEEGNWCTQYYCSQDRRRKQVPLCLRRREEVHYYSQKKETGALLFSGDGI